MWIWKFYCTFHSVLLFLIIVLGYRLLKSYTRWYYFTKFPSPHALLSLHKKKISVLLLFYICPSSSQFLDIAGMNCTFSPRLLLGFLCSVSHISRFLSVHSTHSQSIIIQLGKPHTSQSSLPTIDSFAVSFLYQFFFFIFFSSAFFPLPLLDRVLSGTFSSGYVNDGLRILASQKISFFHPKKWIVSWHMIHPWLLGFSSY